MAKSHPGYNPAGDTHTRLLLAVFETTALGLPTTYSTIVERSNIPRSTLAYHITRLVQQGLLYRQSGVSGMHIAPAGVALLAAKGLIEPVGKQVVYAVTTAGMELLESANS